MPTTINLAHGAKLVSQMREVFLSFPEVASVVSQLGRPDDGTETTSFFSIEFPVDLKPASQWPKGMTKERLVNQIDDKLRRRFPGVSFSYSQNIEDNIDEALSGVKAGSNAVKVFGYDLDTDESIANRITEILKKVRGVTDVFMFRSLGQPNIVVEPDRAAAARYGLNTGDVAAIVQAAIGGQAVTQVLEGDRRFNLVVTLEAASIARRIDAMRNIRVNVPTGGNVPLGQIARVEASEGRVVHLSRRPAALRAGALLGDRARPPGRGGGSQVARRRGNPGARRHPSGMGWASMASCRPPTAASMIVVPLALLMIMGILFAATQSIVNTLILMAQVPLACLGGVLALVVTGTPFSVSAAVGFISIFAIAIMDGILLNFYIHELWEEGHPRSRVDRDGRRSALSRGDDDGAGRRLRAVAGGFLNPDRRADPASARDRGDRRRSRESCC